MTHSPLPRSSSCSPVEYSDPQTSTLLQLLKNISEEVEDSTPNATSVGYTSPLASLNSKLQTLASSRSTSPNVQRGPMGNLIPIKAKSSSPPKLTKEVPAKKSQSLDNFSDASNNTELMKQGKHLNEEPEQMMPLIQITFTESQEKKKFTVDTPSSSMMMQGMEVNSLCFEKV